ncbi:MAG TPA: hypothetical protein PLR04_02210 [Bacilli bacterium]|nr:hypothetical protein [Bacilli bacterium]
MFASLIKLTESDKRLLIAILLVFILLFVIIGLIGYLIVRIMKWQGRRLDSGVSDVVYSRVITDKKAFSRYAHKKNWIIFYKAARIPVIIMLVSGIILLVRNLVYHDFSYDVFNKDDGFASILFLWNFDSTSFSISINTLSEGNLFDINFIPPVLVHEPKFVLDAWGSYLFIPGMAVGGLWYLWCVQSLISRTLRIKKLSESIFDKNLDNFNQNAQLMSSLNVGQRPLNSDTNKDGENKSLGS